MKHLIFTLVTLHLFCFAATAEPVGSAFTYQGRVDHNGVPANGSYDLKFELYAAAAGGNVVGAPIELPARAISNGLFAADLDFGGSAVLNGTAYWLAISVRSAGDSTYVAVPGRTAIRPTPYAIHALSAATVTDGAVSRSSLADGAVTRAKLSAGAVGMAQLDALSAPRVGQVLSFDGTDLSWVTPANGGGAGAGASPWILSGSEPYMTWQDTDSGRNASISSANGTLYYRVPNAANALVTAGYVDSNGMVTRGRLLVEGNEPVITWQDNLSGRSATISTANGTLYYRVPNAANTNVTAGYVDSNGMVVNGRIFVHGTVQATAGVVIGNNPGTPDAPIYSDNAASTRVVLWNTASNGLMDLHCKRGDVTSLTIRGGADLAEPFAMSHTGVEPGTVVVIDAANPGKLMASTHAYDKKVAGIVSGANGIQPGISMIQEDALEAGENVALSGRVYVKADASAGTIEPGDLLTTSAFPGRAMKAADHEAAQGAILGKAMTRLDDGEGLVLVLVTLQ